MDTQTAIQLASQELREEAEYAFKDKVKSILRQIASTSDAIRTLQGQLADEKKTLTELEYEAPEDLTG